MPTTNPTDQQAGWGELWRSDIHRVCGRAERIDLARVLLRNRVSRPLATARACQAPRRNGPAGAVEHWILRRLHVWAQDHAGMDLPWETSIGPGLAVLHGWGLVVSRDAHIGSNVTLFHGVTIGRKDDIDPDGTRTVGGAPTIEDGAWIGPHAIVIGEVRVGAGARIAGGAVVTRDVPPRSLVAGNPARVVQEDVAPDTPNPAPLPR